MDNDQAQIWNQTVSTQATYVYYILGLAAAAIGFCVVQTVDLPFTWSQAAAGSALLAWGLSMHFGILYVRVTMQSLRNNWDHLEATKFRRFNGMALDDTKLKDCLLQLERAMLKTMVKQTRYTVLQYRLFILGFIIFAAWYVIRVTGILE